MAAANNSKMIIPKERGTIFQQHVWKAIARIPRGRVSTYAQIARAIKKPHAARAIGNACNANPFSPRVPCHRVVASNGTLGGYAHGLTAKIKLLKREGVHIIRGRVAEFESVKFQP